MTTAAMLAAIKLSKSISIFGGGSVWCIFDGSEPAAVLSFRFAIGSTVQFVEQCLRLSQVGGVEAFAEPTVDFGEHRMRLTAFALLRKQPRETSRRAQLPPLGALLGAISTARSKQF